MAAASENQQYDEYDQKCRRVHDALLWTREIFPCVHFMQIPPRQEMEWTDSEFTQIADELPSSATLAAAMSEVGPTRDSMDCDLSSGLGLGPNPTNPQTTTTAEGYAKGVRRFLAA